MTGNGSLPTMKDVAREAGVALGTVSKVFNDIPVGDSYRQRVLDAADKLGYQVNCYARGLKTNKTRSVALIIPNIIHPFFASLAQNVCHSLSRRGYRLILALTDFSLDTEQTCLRMAQQNKVDGIIGLTYNPTLTIGSNIPFVSFDRYFSSDVPCVSSDNYGGGQTAARKLEELGCRSMLFLRIGSTIRGETDKRGEGFENYCSAKGIPCDSLRLPDGSSDDLFRDFLVQHVHDGRLDYDGIFCSSDGLVITIRNILYDMNIRVPEDVQMIGFDGISAWGLGIPCSTIIQPVEELAETCVDIVLKEDRTHLPSMICLPVTYASGGTTREP